MAAWQEETLKKIIAYFENDTDILALLLFGSLNAGISQADYWSDIDILIVTTKDKDKELFTEIDWLNVFGNLYTYAQSRGKFTYTTRACFDDLRRIDIVLTTEEKLLNAKKDSQSILQPNTKILFSRSDVVTQAVEAAVAQVTFLPASEEVFQKMVREFRFKSMLATYKVVRNDLLIALHLSLDLIRDCSVLGMLLRDRVEKTNIHKDGGIGNLTVQSLQATQQPYTATGILDSIEQSNIIFEKLAKEWSPAYQENREPLLNWIEKARKEISYRKTKSSL